MAFIKCDIVGRCDRYMLTYAKVEVIQITGWGSLPPFFNANLQDFQFFFAFNYCLTIPHYPKKKEIRDFLKIFPLIEENI